MKKHLHALTAWMLIVMLLVSNTVNVMAVEPVVGGRTDVSSELTQSTEMDDDALTEETEPATEAATETEEESTTSAEEESTEGASEEAKESAEESEASSKVEESSTEASEDTSAAEENNAAASATTAKAEETATEPSEGVPEAETTAESKAVSTASDITKDEEINPNGDYLYELSTTSTDGKVVVTATMDESAGIETGTTIHAEPITGARLTYVLRVAGEAAGVEKDNAYGFAYDVYLLKNGKRVEPNESIHISMQYTEPMTIDIPEGSEIQSLQLCHIHNKDVEVLDSTIDAEDNAVSAAEFDLSSFSPLVTLASVEPGIMTAANYSSDLEDFLTEVTIEGATNDGENYVVRPDTTYKITIHAEESENNQFNNESLTYTLPQGFEEPSASGVIENISITNSGTTYLVKGTKWSVDKGVLTLTWDKNDENYSHLIACSNVTVKLQLEGKFDSNATEIKWSDSVSTKIKVDSSNSVDVTKSYSQDSDDKTLGHYTVTVTSTGKSENVVVNDTIGGTALKLATNTINISSNKKESVTASASSSSEKGFSYTFDSMEDGEVITITYDATVDLSGLTGVATAETTGNSVSVKSKDKPEEKTASKTFEIDVTPSISKSAGTSGDVDTEGYRTITWTITYNDNMLKSAADHVIKDAIAENSKERMSYSGPVHVKVTDQSGNIVRDENVLTPTTGATDWTYTIPATDTAVYKYVFTYSTKVKVSDLIDATIVTNTAKDETSDKGTSGSQTVQPEDKNQAGVDKNVVSASSTEITWKIKIDVPASGLSSAVLTDTYPNHSNNGYKDTFKESSVVVKDLESGESWSGEDRDGKYIITFKNDGNDGLRGTGSKRQITVTLTTMVDQSWLSKAEESGYEWLKGHKNNVTFTAEGIPFTDSATAYPAQISIQKKGESVSGQQLPTYKYTVVLKGITEQNFEIEDTFDTELLQYVTIPYASSNKVYSGDQYSQSTEAGTYSVQTQNNGMKISANLTTNPAGGENYKIEYYLQVKDKNALKKLTEEAGKDSELKAVLSNTAVYGSTSASAQVEYQYKPLTKQILNEGTLATDRKANFQIVVNPDAIQMNDGNSMVVEDAYSNNLNMDISSIVFDPAEGCSATTEGGKLKFTVPDSTKVIITYSGSIGGSGSVTISNVATLKGQNAGGSKAVTIDAKGEGTGSVPDITIYKYDATKTSKGLPDAKFKLYQIVDGTETQVGNTFTTDANGKVTIKGTQDGEGATGWTLWKDRQYYLEEVTAPSGYKMSTVKYQFKLSDNADYSNGVYALSGDQIDISNTPIEDDEKEVIFSKVIAGQSQELSGAKLQIFKITGNTETKVKEWTSTGTAQKFTLKEGVYKLVEDQAPNGYQKAESITFQIVKGNDGKLKVQVQKGNTWDDVQNATITMEDKPEEKATISVGVKKVWDDAENQDGKRPTKVNVALYNGSGKVTVDQDNQQINDIELSESNNWTASWSNLPKQTDEGTAITYTVKEVDESNNKITFTKQEGGKTESVEYSVSYSGPTEVEGGKQYTITNSYTPKTRNINVEKKWAGSTSAEEELRPTSIEVQLYADGQPCKINGQDAKLTLVASTIGSQSWTGSWDNLPVNKLKDGKSTPITYTVKEIGEQSGKITFNANDTAKKVSYDVSYAENDVVAVPTFTITNTYNKTKVKISKKDITNSNELAGAELKITSGANTVDSWTSSAAMVHEVELADGEYTLTETTAPQGYQVAESITFKVENQKVYTKNAENNWVAQDGNLVVMEDQPIDTASVIVKKDWQDADNENQKRPTSVKVKLSASVNNTEVENITDNDGKAVTTVKTLEKDSWTASWSNLPKTDANGNSISYTVKESDESNGTVNIDGTSYNVNYSNMTASADGKTYSMTITNTYELKKLSFSKVIAGQGTELAGAELKIVSGTDESNVIRSWISDGNAKEFSLPEGTYKLVEDKAPLGYLQAEAIEFKIEKDESGALQLLIKQGDNDWKTPDEAKVIMEDAIDTRSISVEKHWKGDTGAENSLRPSSITVRLFGNDKTNALQTATITPDERGNWSYTFTGLPVYANGEVISYSVSEDSVKDYTNVVSGSMEDGFTITNTYTPGKSTVTISKVDLGGTEIAGAKLTVTGRETGAGEDIRPITWTSEAGKSHQVDLKPGEYTLTETTAPNGYLKAESIGFSITKDGKVLVNGEEVNGRITMVDDYESHTVNFSKTAVNGTKELVGAALTVTGNEDGSGKQISESWTSGESQKVLSLKPGTYTMTENQAPTGYLIAESITFRVTAEGQILIKNGESWTEAENATVHMEDTRKSSGNGGGSGGGGGGDWHAVTTAPEVTTAPSTEETTTVVEGGDVNGDSRDGEVETNPDGSVKGAGRGRNGNGDDGDVNGAKRGVLTGDQAMTLLWGAGFMCCAILLLAWVRRRKR